MDIFKGFLFSILFTLPVIFIFALAVHFSGKQRPIKRGGQRLTSSSPLLYLIISLGVLFTCFLFFVIFTDENIRDNNLFYYGLLLVAIAFMGMSICGCLEAKFITTGWDCESLFQYGYRMPRTSIKWADIHDVHVKPGYSYKFIGKGSKISVWTGAGGCKQLIRFARRKLPALAHKLPDPFVALDF